MSAIFTNQQLKIIWTCYERDGTTVIDLTGKTVKILIRDPAGTESTEDATIEDAGAGQCSYTWAADALDVEGWWSAKPYLNTSQTPGTVYRFRVEGIWDA